MNRMMMATALALAGGAATAPASASLIGDTVTLSDTALDISSGGSAVVGAGAEFTLLNFGIPAASLDVDSSSVTFTSVGMGRTGFRGSIAFTLGDLDFAGAPGGITGLTLTLAGDLTGIEAADLSFTADSLTVIYGGSSFSSGSSFTVTFVTAPDTPDTPVPEPAALALFGAGLLGLAGATRRRGQRVR